MVMHAKQMEHDISPSKLSGRRLEMWLGFLMKKRITVKEMLILHLPNCYQRIFIFRHNTLALQRHFKGRYLIKNWIYFLFFVGGIGEEGGMGNGRAFAGIY